MSHKTATVAAAGVFSLVVLANDKIAGAVELTDDQMDLITAGAWTYTGSPQLNTEILTDGRGYTYTFVSLPECMSCYMDNHNGLWSTQGQVHFYDGGIALGILSNTVTGQKWDGGLPAQGPLPTVPAARPAA